MPLCENNYQQKQNSIRCFFYTNIYSIPKLKKSTVWFIKSNDYSQKTLIKIATFLELITFQRFFLLRAKKSFSNLKISKGVSIGAKITLRKKNLYLFIFKLLYQVLPANKISNFYKKKKLHRSFYRVNTLLLVIPSVLHFFELQSFFLFFNKFLNLNILFSFSESITQKEFVFTNCFLKIPA